MRAEGLVAYTPRLDDGPSRRQSRSFRKPVHIDCIMCLRGNKLRGDLKNSQPIPMRQEGKASDAPGASANLLLPGDFC